MLTPYFVTDYVTVSWDTELECVISVWNGYTGGGQGKVQIGNNKALELVSEKKARKWLSDLLEMRVMDQADQLWLSTELVPQVALRGVHYVALVFPSSMVAQFSVKNVINRVESLNLDMGNFDNLKDARTWLASKK
jgi:hypothetical protein